MTTRFSVDWRGYFLALTAVFFWSFNVVIAQRFATDLTPVEFAFGRWLLAGCLLVPWTARSLWQNRHFLIQHWIWIIGLALTGIVLDNTLIYIAGHTIDAVSMSLLNLLGPIFLVWLTVFFLKVPVRIGQIIGMAIAVIGVMVIVTNGRWSGLTGSMWRIGDVWIILNAFCFAVYSFLQYKRPAYLPQATLLAATVIVGVMMLLPFLVMTTPWDRISSFSVTDYSIFIYLGIFNSVLAYLCWNNALGRIGSMKTGIVYYLLPVFSMIEAAFFLGIYIGWPQVIGGIGVIVGVYIVSRFQTPPVLIQASAKQRTNQLRG